MSDWITYLRPNVYLRDVAFSDLGDFFALEQDLHPPVPVAKSQRNALAAYAARWIPNLMDSTCTNRTVVWNDEIAGYVSCSNTMDQPALHLFIRKSHRQQGLGCQALHEMLSHVLARPILAKTHTGNLAAIRLLLRCGFERCRDGDALDTGGGELVFELH